MSSKTAAATLAPWLKAMRAHRWFDANEVATASRMGTPMRGDSFACTAAPAFRA